MKVKTQNLLILDNLNYQQQHDFNNTDFNNAIQIAEANNFGVAYSNQAFEYWIILHFNDHQGGGLDRRDLAIERAKRNYDFFGHSNCASEESSTTVFKLVEELLKYI